MRKLVISVALATLLAGTAHAQFGPIGSAAESVGQAAGNAVQSGANAVKEGTGLVTGGAGSERDAKARIEAGGYSNVTGLNRDSTGVWHAKAQKQGMPVVVSLYADGTVKTD